MATDVFIFQKGRDGGLISRLRSGKVVLLRRGGNSAKVKEDEAWECLIEEKERFCLATPVARHEEKILTAKQGNLFWRLRSGFSVIREEAILGYEFVSKPCKGYIAREVFAVVDGAEYKLCDRDMEELSGNESFQKVFEEKAALEAVDRAEAEERYAREEKERLQKYLAEAEKNFMDIGLSLKQSGEYVYSGSVSLRVETLSEKKYVAVAFSGRKLLVNLVGGYRATGFTFRDDTDQMEWHTSVTTISLGERFSGKNLITLRGFEGFFFEEKEAHEERLRAEKLARKIAEAEVAQASAVEIHRYDVWQYGGGRHELLCLCRKNQELSVFGVVDGKGEVVGQFMCDSCLTDKAKELLAKK